MLHLEIKANKKSTEISQHNWELKGSSIRYQIRWDIVSRAHSYYSPYSVRIQENTDQKNSVFGHFSRSEWLHTEMRSMSDGEINYSKGRSLFPT